jgi:hypothetical protein
MRLGDQAAHGGRDTDFRLAAAFRSERWRCVCRIADRRSREQSVPGFSFGSFGHTR